MGLFGEEENISWGMTLAVVGIICAVTGCGAWPVRSASLVEGD